MSIRKISFASIRARIILLTCIGIFLIGAIALINRVLDGYKNDNMEVERLSNAVSLNVTEIMMIEARFMQTPKPGLLEQIAPRRKALKDAIEKVKSVASDNEILSQATVILSVDQRHAEAFEKAAENVQTIFDNQRSIVEKLNQSNDAMNGVVKNIDEIEVQALMNEGATLDYSLAAIRSEIKDFSRLGDKVLVRIQNLLLNGDYEAYKTREKKAGQVMELRLVNLQTAFEAVESDEYEQAWENAREIAPHIQTLESDTIARWLENKDLRTVLEDTRRDITSAAADMAELAGKRIRNSRVAQDWVSLFVSVLGIAGLLVLGAAITRSIVKPINMAVEGLKEISQGSGDLTVQLPDQDQNEMGELARAFNLFVKKQHAMVSETARAAESLMAYTAEVTTTASQLAASAAEETTTVSQVSSTTEQVKQTVALSNDKAEKTASDSDSMIKVSHTGLKATEKASEGMTTIRDEMELVAQSIVRLSEQTKNIGEIIDAVNELANQSDLLSVNASIEAAKAGEFGKGFSVVATEVKSLAEQSQQATVQIRGILRDIHQATGEAVTAAERGAKAVEKGVELSSQSGSVIQELSHSIEDSVRSAQQIASSCRQQLAGMEQLDAAMQSISHASSQNLESSRRLEDLTQSLSELSKTLENLTGRFKL